MGDSERFYVQTNTNGKHLLSLKIIEHVISSMPEEHYYKLKNNSGYDKVARFIKIVNYNDDCYEYLKYKDIFDIADNFLDISMKILLGKQADIFIDKDLLFSKALHHVMMKKEYDEKLIEISQVIKNLINKTKKKEINHIRTADKISIVDTFSYQESFEKRYTVETPTTMISQANEDINLFISVKNLLVQPLTYLRGDRVILDGYKWIERDIDTENSRYYQECEDFYDISEKYSNNILAIDFLSRIIPFIYSGEISVSRFIGIYKHKDIKFIIHLIGANEAGSIFLESDLESIN